MNPSDDNPFRRLVLPGVLLAIALVAAIALVNRGLYAAELFEMGDAAANSLLIQDAKHLSLLTGNYSRLGFHHPGPAILYALAAGEFLFHDATGWVRSPIAGQLIGGHLYNAFWTVLLFVLLARLLRSRLLGASGVLVFLALATVQDPQYVVGIWFPFLYFMPFAVLTAAVARLSAGHLGESWALCLAASVLVHGHASFVAIVGIMVAGGLLGYAWTARRLAAGPGWRPHLAEELRRNRVPLVASGAVVALFAATIVANTIVNYPGDIPKYIAYRGGFEGNGWRDALEFVAYFWGGTGTIALTVGIVALGLLWTSRGVPGAADARVDAAGARGAAWAVGLATLALAFYAKTGIDFLAMKYTGYFYFAAVAIAAATGIAVVADRFGHAARFALAVAAVLAGAAAAVYGLKPSHVESTADIPRLFATFREMPRRPAVLDLDASTEWQRLWSTVVGVASYSTRRSERVLCVNRNWHLLFTERYRCTEEDLRSGTRFLATARKVESRPGDGLFALADLRFVPGALVRVRDGETLLFVDSNAPVATRALGGGWSVPERDFTWSVGPRSTVEFQVERPGALRLALDVSAYLPYPDSTQEVQVWANGRALGTMQFTPAGNRGERIIALPPDLVPGDGLVQLELRVRKPVSPASTGTSKDSRALGVALRGLRVVRDPG